MKKASSFASLALVGLFAPQSAWAGWPSQSPAAPTAPAAPGKSPPLPPAPAPAAKSAARATPPPKPPVRLRAGLDIDLALAVGRLGDAVGFGIGAPWSRARLAPRGGHHPPRQIRFSL